MKASAALLITAAVSVWVCFLVEDAVFSVVVLEDEVVGMQHLHKRPAAGVSYLVRDLDALNLLPPRSVIEL